jgi:GT2 family glycosyltransferase
MLYPMELKSQHYSTAIIILNWNGFEVTKECLESLVKVDNVNLNVILVDNGSKDGSVEKFNNLFLNDEIDLIALEKNIGFTGGNNVGIKYAMDKYNPDFYLLLNNDTIVEPDFLEVMLRAFERDPLCFAVVPKILYYDRPDVIWFAGGKISRITGIANHYGINKVDNKEYNIPGNTHFMNGCCALISKASIEVLGGLDDRFFANSEDVDYSWRILDYERNIYYEPRARIYHKVNYSFKANRGKWLAFYLAARGIVLLQVKHLPGYKLPVFFCAFFLRWVAYLTFKLFFLGDLRSIKGIYQGVFDGIQKRLRFVGK